MPLRRRRRERAAAAADSATDAGNQELRAARAASEPSAPESLQNLPPLVLQRRPAELPTPDRCPCCLLENKGTIDSFAAHLRSHLAELRAAVDWEAVRREEERVRSVIESWDAELQASGDAVLASPESALEARAAAGTQPLRAASSASSSSSSSSSASDSSSSSFSSHGNPAALVNVGAAPLRSSPAESRPSKRRALEDAPEKRGAVLLPVKPDPEPSAAALARGKSSGIAGAREESAPRAGRSPFQLVLPLDVASPARPRAHGASISRPPALAASLAAPHPLPFLPSPSPSPALSWTGAVPRTMLVAPHGPQHLPPSPAEVFTFALPSRSLPPPAPAPPQAAPPWRANPLRR